MADIQFDEPQYAASVSAPKESWLSSLVIRTGLATDSASAQKVLIIVLVVTIVATILVWAL